jgi:hypothetical protein
VIKMDNEKQLPKRKTPRIKNYDYSSKSAYLVTICVKDRKLILSEIVITNTTASVPTINPTVGEGLAPPLP